MVHSTIYGLLICTVIVSIACAASSKNDHNLRIRSKDTSNNHVLRKDALLEEVNEKLKDYDSSKIPVSKRVLTVYHLGVPSLDYSVDVVVNNIKVFTAAVHSHVDSTHVEGLYLFNLLSGEANPYFKYIPCELNNVLCVHLDHESTELEQIVDMETHKDITDVLGRSIISQFKGVFFLNHEARGPFSKARNGEWLSSFAQLIDLPNSLPSATQRRSSSTSTSSDGSSFLDAHKGHAIMMVGRQHNYRDSGTKPIGAVSVAITCEPVPRLLTHAFMLSASLVSRVFSTVAIHSVEETQTHNRTDQLAAVLTTQMLRSGVSIASILQQNMLASEHSSTEKAAGTSSTSGGSSSSAGRYRDKDKDKESHYDHQHEQEHEDRTEVKRDHNMIDQSSHGDTLEGAILGHNMEQEGRHLSSKSSKPKSLSALQVNKAIFDNRCFISHSNEKNSSNPMKWCDLQPSDIVFARFGGTMLKTPGVMCEDAIKSISAATAAIAAAESTLKLHMPESVYGGPYRELYRQYSVQQWRWQQPSPNMHFLDTAPTKAAKHSYFGMSSKQHSDKSLTAAAAVPLVCFLVRSASVHSLKSDASQPASNLVKMDISLLINTLVKQVNPYWRAYFFVTDDNPFETELRSILQGHKDSRLEYLNIPLEYRPTFTSTDAGYTATDYALSVILNKPECRWITVSNADNAYGTHIVDNVHKVRDDPVTGLAPSMVLAPLDSRNLAEQDYLMRAALRGGKTGGWRERCVGVETSLKLHLFVYTIQSLPLVGRVDLAAVFLDARKFKNEQLFFSNFSDVSKYSCKGCQDGYLTETLVTQRFWSYVQLPIDGLRSMVFHGPSPTLCIASGNVWFDFPEVNKLGCVSHRTIGQLYPSPFYDFSRFYDARSPRVCLRLSQKGFWNRTASVIT